MVKNRFKYLAYKQPDFKYLQDTKKRQKQQSKGWTKASQDGFYTSKEWIALRDYKRLLNPICERCEKMNVITPMEVVDHITPVEVSEELKLSLDNLQSLCRSCHTIKTREDQYGRYEDITIRNKFEDYN